MKRIVNYKVLSLLVFLMLTLLFSCETHVIDDGSEIVEISCDPNTSYTTQIQPIIENNCVTCHNGSQPPNLNSYSRVSNNASLIKSVVVSRRMPLSGSLSTEEIALISCWVDNGAENN